MTKDKTNPTDDLFEDLEFDESRLGSRAQQLRNVRDRLLKTARRAARQIPFMDEVLASYYCTRDPRTPAKVKLTMTAALAYFVLPLDAVPDVLLLIGFGDDTAVLLAALSMVRSHIRPEHREAAKRALESDRLDDNEAAADTNSMSGAGMPDPFSHPA
ncbi:DUF1232 domain-containing protein [Roseibium sp. CAU 1637]|uniref:DUF1232 domain-containing protein n=1 Tax=Roseibium limicola TaxID=2816037 RepID=A0A939JAL9_9HYPH|nr:YkvA family protein [Roseibium limicola]MBO0346568.1 DUF1232 domain-containing protein [Roseibium limicola]